MKIISLYVLLIISFFLAVKTTNIILPDFIQGNIFFESILLKFRDNSLNEFVAYVSSTLVGFFLAVIYDTNKERKKYNRIKEKEKPYIEGVIQSSASIFLHINKQSRINKVKFPVESFDELIPSLKEINIDDFYVLEYVNGKTGKRYREKLLIVILNNIDYLKTRIEKKVNFIDEPGISKSLSELISHCELFSQTYSAYPAIKENSSVSNANNIYFFYKDLLMKIFLTSQNLAKQYNLTYSEKLDEDIWYNMHCKQESSN